MELIHPFFEALDTACSSSNPESGTGLFLLHVFCADTPRKKNPPSFAEGSVADPVPETQVPKLLSTIDTSRRPGKRCQHDPVSQFRSSVR